MFQNRQGPMMKKILNFQNLFLEARIGEILEKRKWPQIKEKDGAPGRNRTCDLRIRSPTLYPTELQARALRKGMKRELIYVQKSW